jgi:cyclophilin family peptidyl-prolyl cis-trans isomerase
MPIKTIVAIAAVLSIVATACSSDEPAQTNPPTTAAEATTPGLPPSTNAEFRAQPTSCGSQIPPEPTSQTYDAPLNAAVAGQTTITLTTSCGPITILVDPSVAPETVNSFVFLAEEGYFDGTVSHRIMPGFMMQAGDPTGTGLGGPGYTIPDELPADGYIYERGTVAMANAGPETGGSQFFIMFGTADWLPPAYAVFGQVVDGFAVLDAIEQVPLGMSASGSDSTPSTPLETVYIDSVAVQR